MNEKKLNILIVTQYFWPENMRINDLVKEFSAKGHHVTVLTGLPNYPDGVLFSEYKTNKGEFSSYNDAKIIRIPMVVRGKSHITLVLNYISFFLSASTLGLFKLRKQSFDSIFVYAVSPIMAAIPAILIGRLKKTPVFIWVLDLWPETLSAVGVVKNKLALNCVGKVVSWIYNRSDYILLQSRAFKSNILNYCTRPIDGKRIIYFPSWAENIIQVKETINNPILPRNGNYFTIVFAGNIGEAQDFPTIVNVFEKLKSEKLIRLVVVGEGQMFSWLKKQVESRELHNILLLGRHPIEEMPGLFASADALLVSLKCNDIFAKTIPGKLQAYLASNKPIIGMIDGEAAQVITESASGLVGPASDEIALINNVCALKNMNKDEREAMGKAGLKYYQENFQSEGLFLSLEHLFYDAELRKNDNKYNE